MRTFDLTLRLRPDMPVFPGDPAFSLRSALSAVPGDPDSYSIGVMTLSTHTGTHVDAPAHFVPGGPGVDTIPLETLCGPGLVADLRAYGPAIDRSAVEAALRPGIRRLLIRGLEAGQDPAGPGYPHLTLEAARFLRHEARVRLVGIDSLSIETYPSPGFPVHHAFLAGDGPVVIVEGLALDAVPPGPVTMWCLPIPLEGADGAPCRVVVRGREVGPRSTVRSGRGRAN